MYDKCLGGFRGLAIGDALGAPVEFMPRGSFSRITDYQKTEHFDLPPGYWTDDTSMAICLAQILIENKKYSSDAVLTKYCEWFFDGVNSSTGYCFDIGGQTSKSLLTFQYKRTTDNTLLTSTTNSAGNGTIMRLVPLVIYALTLPSPYFIDIRQNLYAQSAIDTHPNSLVIACTKIFGLLLEGLIKGMTSTDSLDYAMKYNNINDVLLKDKIFNELLTVDDNSAGSDGYVLSSLSSSWWAFTSSDSFENAVLKAVNLGGDADTLGAITGQLAGAFYGDESIPTSLKEGLFSSSIFESLTHELMNINHA